MPTTRAAQHDSMEQPGLTQFYRQTPADDLKSMILRLQCLAPFKLDGDLAQRFAYIKMFDDTFTMDTAREEAAKLLLAVKTTTEQKQQMKAAKSGKKTPDWYPSLRGEPEKPTYSPKPDTRVRIGETTADAVDQLKEAVPCQTVYLGLGYKKDKREAGPKFYLRNGHTVEKGYVQFSDPDIFKQEFELLKTSYARFQDEEQPAIDAARLAYHKQMFIYDYARIYLSIYGPPIEEELDQAHRLRVYEKYHGKSDRAADTYKESELKNMSRWGEQSFDKLLDSQFGYLCGLDVTDTILTNPPVPVEALAAFKTKHPEYFQDQTRPVRRRRTLLAEDEDDEPIAAAELPGSDLVQAKTVPQPGEANINKPFMPELAAALTKLPCHYRIAIGAQKPRVCLRGGQWYIDSDAQIELVLCLREKQGHFGEADLDAVLKGRALQPPSSDRACKQCDGPIIIPDD